MESEFSTNYKAGDRDSSYKIDGYSYDDEIEDYDDDEIKILTKILNKVKKKPKKVIKKPKKVKIKLGDDSSIKTNYNSQNNYYV